MVVDKDLVSRVAELARIGVSADRMESLAVELSGILDWIEQLNELDTDGVVPLATAVDAKLPWREDRVTEGNSRDEILRNAPISSDGFFLVPKVMD